MTLSRRVFVSLAGFTPLFRWIAPTGAAVPPAQERPDDLVVVKGWVLRRDDLERLPLA
jgi:hypothetical protein